MNKPENIIDFELVKEIESKAIELRGQIIHLFILIEAIMDNLIRKTTFESEVKYDWVTKTLRKEKLTMDIKLVMFKKCIDEFESKYKLDLSFLKSNINTIVEKRDCLAHCPLDTTKEGIQNFKINKAITFIKLKKNIREKEKDVLFTPESIKKLKENIKQAAKDAFKMQNTFHENEEENKN